MGAPLEVHFSFERLLLYFLHFTSKWYQVQKKTGYKIIMHKYAQCWAGALNYLKYSQTNNNWERKKNNRQIVWTTFLILNCMQRKRMKHGYSQTPQSTPLIVLILSNSRQKNKTKHRIWQSTFAYYIEYRTEPNRTAPNNTVAHHNSMTYLK